MRKNSLVLTGFLISSLLLAGCDSSKPNVNFFFYNKNDSFINELSNNLYFHFQKKYNVKIDYANNTQSQQNSQIVDALDKGSDLLVVNICDRLAASSIIEKASKTKTPIIFSNREPLISDILLEDNIYYVGTDPIFEGTQQAKIADEFFDGAANFPHSEFDKNNDGKLQVYLLKGENGHQDTELRSKFSKTTLSQLGYDVDIVQTTSADWEREKAKVEFQKVYNEIQQNNSPEIELVLSNNDDMAIGVSDYLVTLPEYDSEITISKQFFPIIGVNGNDFGIRAITDGLIYGTVKNDSKSQADAIFKLADRILNNLPLTDFEYSFDNERFIHIEGQAITEQTLITSVDEKIPN